MKRSNEYENPLPGCVIDHTITRRHMYDFFLVPQSVRQGTVSPTHYIVVHDSANFAPDILQRLSFKLCFLYYNWPGTVRVPACCQVFIWHYTLNENIKNILFAVCPQTGIPGWTVRGSRSGRLPLRQAVLPLDWGRARGPTQLLECAVYLKRLTKFDWIEIWIIVVFIFIYTFLCYQIEMNYYNMWKQILIYIYYLK